MATDDERLVVAIEARIRDFERNMQKASRTAGDQFGKIERRAKQSGDKLESTMSVAAARASTALKGIGAGIFAGLAAGGVAGIVNQIGQVAKGIAQIGDEAKRAGVSNRVFQEWATVAEQARIPVDAMIDGLKELQLRGDEVATTGKGSAAEAFGRLGYSAEELKRKLADPSALLLEIIDRLGKFDKAAQIRISDELFGGSAGERFVELLDQGAAGIRKTIDEAHALGNVLSDEVIERAAEIDRQFKIVSQTVGTHLKGAIVNAASALQQFIDSFRNFEDQQAATLDAKLATIGQQRLDLENKILKLRGQQADAGFNPFGADYEEQIRFLEDERAALGETEAQILAVVEARRKARESAQAKSATVADFTPAPYVPPPPPGNGGASRSSSASAIERERQAVAELIAELERELSLIGASDLQRQISNALRDAGAAATDDQRAKIVALITAIEAETAAQERGNDAKERFGQLASGALSGFAQDLLNGVSAGDAFASMLNRLAGQLIDLAIQAAIVKPLMSVFGFAGGGIVSADPWAGLRLASGGYVSGPGTSTSDSIPARLSDGEFVVNAAATRKHRALLEAVNDNRLPAFAAGGLAGRGLPPIAANDNAPAISINAPITVNGSAGTPEQNADLARQMSKQLEATMRGVVADEMRRATRPGNPFGRR